MTVLRSAPMRPSEDVHRGGRHGSWPALIGQAALIVAAALAYFFVRWLTEGSLGAATRNAGRVIGAERALGIQVEDGVQDAIIGHDRLVDLANWVYVYGHWPVIGMTLVILFLRAPAEYRILRNAMFISGAIGLLVFALFPVAPPRLGLLDLADTVAERSTSYRTLQPPALVNHYAAMPSLHAGWNLLVGIAVWRATSRRWLRVLAVLSPVAMSWAVVATANHYVLDVVAGMAVALGGLAAALVLRARAERRDAAGVPA